MRKYTAEVQRKETLKDILEAGETMDQRPLEMAAKVSLIRRKI